MLCRLVFEEQSMLSVHKSLPVQCISLMYDRRPWCYGGIGVLSLFLSIPRLSWVTFRPWPPGKAGIQAVHCPLEGEAIEGPYVEFMCHPLFLWPAYAPPSVSGPGPAPWPVGPLSGPKAPCIGRGNPRVNRASKLLDRMAPIPARPGGTRLQVPIAPMAPHDWPEQIPLPLYFPFPSLFLLVEVAALFALTPPCPRRGGGGRGDAWGANILH